MLFPSHRVPLCVSVCPAGEAVRDGGSEAAAGGDGETEGGIQRHHRETQTGDGSLLWRLPFFIVSFQLFICPQAFPLKQIKYTINYLQY